MQIVINISEDNYKLIKDGNCCGVLSYEIYNAIKNGTVLPKGHGDLIDKNDLLKHKHTIGTSNYCEYNVVYVETIDNTRPIIEADKKERR